ncbi:hypothetical protein [Candidatus Hamiltonella defensa]|uniref:hypothetical protein n=1 Tax=Candidatus Williamhamiltonella defendens TaxID=138072 RepID=UPI0012FD5C85|nr:hypothetical protein [Candidatus Hamiltonella defensa]
MLTCDMYSSSSPDFFDQFASTSQEQTTGKDEFRKSSEWKDFSSRIANTLWGDRNKAE